jgi:purine-binding chemotaxis protein CheW
MEEDGMSMLVLITMIAGQRVAIDAARIESVVDLWQVVPVPLVPSHVVGIAAVRSRVMTVIDTAGAIGLRAKATGNRAIVIEASGHSYALRVDAIEDVCTVIGNVEPFHEGIGANWTGIATGTVDTAFGFALLVNPADLIGAQHAEAA